MSELKTIDEVALILRCSDTHLRRLIKRGKISYRKFGRSYTFTDQDINDFLEREKKIRGKAPAEAVDE